MSINIDWELLRQKLINKPQLLGEPPTPVYSNTYDEGIPKYSIVMPVYNQVKIIVNNLESIIRYTTNCYEMIIILDACNDGTEEAVLKWASEPKPSNLFKLFILKSSYPLFETVADNCGFLLSRGEYIIEIQADMEMAESGYNERLAKAMKYNNVIGVSGRCCHSFNGRMRIGKLGEAIANPIDKKSRRDIFYVLDTCNRGPLLLHRERLDEMGYLDEQNFYLDNSDHDLFARSKYQKDWICGYISLVFHAPLDQGSTRKPRDSINQFYASQYEARSDGGYYGILKQTGVPLTRLTYLPIDL